MYYANICALVIAGSTGSALHEPAHLLYRCPKSRSKSRTTLVQARMLTIAVCDLRL
jgi:hypothetical protein